MEVASRTDPPARACLGAHRRVDRVLVHGQLHAALFRRALGVCVARGAAAVNRAPSLAVNAPQAHSAHRRTAVQRRCASAWFCRPCACHTAGVRTYVRLSPAIAGAGAQLAAAAAGPPLAWRASPNVADQGNKDAAWLLKLIVEAVSHRSRGEQVMTTDRSSRSERADGRRNGLRRSEGPADEPAALRFTRKNLLGSLPVPPCAAELTFAGVHRK